MNMDMKEKVWIALEDVIDPEVHVNIVDLGLVYDITVQDEQDVRITMTLTVPECPMKDDILRDVKSKAGAVPGVEHVEVEFVWEPAWSPSRMTDQGIEEFKRQRSMM